MQSSDKLNRFLWAFSAEITTKVDLEIKFRVDISLYRVCAYIEHVASRDKTC